MNTAFSLIVKVFVALVCTVSFAFAKDPLPDRIIPASFGIQLKPETFNVTVLNQVHANGLGFCVIRNSFYWKDVEKTKGVYDFSDYDETMQYAKKLGFTVVGCLFGSNSLYEDVEKGGILTEAGRKGFADFAAAVAKRYKDQNVLWEIWNEPNIKGFWRKDGSHNTPEFANEYTELVKETAPAILKVVPDAYILAGSLSSYWEPSYQWSQLCFQRGILQTGIRGWSVHPHGAKNPEEEGDGHKCLRGLLAKYGAPEMPLLNTSRGFAVKETATGWDGGSKERAREYQAWNFVRQFLLDQLYDIRLTIWHEWAGEKCGLSDEGGSRPIHKAAVTMFAQLDGYRVVRRLESDSDLDYVVLFAKKSGERKLAVWTAPPPKSSPGDAKTHGVSLAVTSPASFSGELKTVNINGEPGKAKASGGAIQLNLEGAPQYVTIPAGMEFGKVTTDLSPAVTPSSAPPAGVEKVN